MSLYILNDQLNLQPHGIVNSTMIRTSEVHCHCGEQQQHEQRGERRAAAAAGPAQLAPREPDVTAHWHRRLRRTVSHTSLIAVAGPSVFQLNKKKVIAFKPISKCFTLVNVHVCYISRSLLIQFVLIRRFPSTEWCRMKKEITGQK